MPIVNIPPLVDKAMKAFIGKFLSNKAQQKHMAEYLTGLMLSNNKTVTGITDMFPNASDQSCLNRFLTQGEWDEQALNKARIEYLQQFKDTQFHPKGVLALDDVLIDKTGKQIPFAGKLWDHVAQCYTFAQDLLIINYVNPTSEKHFPLDYRLFRKEDQCDVVDSTQTDDQDNGDKVVFKKLTTLAIELFDWCAENDIPGTITFDSYYSTNEILNHINAMKIQGPKGEESRGYVADLKFNRIIEFKGKRQVQEFAKSIPVQDRKPIMVSGQKQWYLTHCVNMLNVDHRVRIVILWKHKNDAQPAKILVTNKKHWNVTRILETYGYRWTGTETFHRDGKQELGLGACQLRSQKGQPRHFYLVFLAYSLLVHELDKTSLNAWAHCKLATIGEACRALYSDSQKSLVVWIAHQIESACKLKTGIKETLQSLLVSLKLATA